MNSSEAIHAIIHSSTDAATACHTNLRSFRAKFTQ